ncbi:hypothetical protein AFERRI_530101 [Acidithiobacillus ferrivorans]|uniref:Uncharacterized protein n=1 Tax=Acidithiobacillus ferrivorans TaxID=160808 RepID=A0A060USA8_9PROT|nr:hypothetical protein AFERRI_530101 [Acidithiobacillus ferrivorans]
MPSLFYALPNFYGWHSAVEVRAPAGTLLPPVATMQGWLQAAKVPVTRVNSDGQSASAAGCGSHGWQHHGLQPCPTRAEPRTGRPEC